MPPFFSLSQIYFVHFKGIRRLYLGMPFHVPLHIKEILRVGVGGVSIVRVFRQIVFLREKRTDTPQHIDTLSSPVSCDTRPALVKSCPD